MRARHSKVEAGVETSVMTDLNSVSTLLITTVITLLLVWCPRLGGASWPYCCILNGPCVISSS